MVASQAAWYRMENGPKHEHRKKWIEMAHCPKWGKMAPKWRKNRKMTPFPHFWAILSPFWDVGHFLLSDHFFLILALQPLFHSIPGSLTRKFMAPFRLLKVRPGQSGVGEHRFRKFTPIFVNLRRFFVNSAKIRRKFRFGENSA